MLFNTIYITLITVHMENECFRTQLLEMKMSLYNVRHLLLTEKSWI